MHKLLERQVRHVFGSPDGIPDKVASFVAAVEEAYRSGDADRALLERSLELTSQELVQRNDELRRDVEELQRTRAQLSAANERLQKLVGFRTAFLNTTAHELATPLTPLLLQSHMLMRRAAEFNDEPLQKGIKMMHRNLSRLNSLVQDVLDAARIQGGRLRLSPEAIDAGRLLQETVESFAVLADEAGVTIEIQKRGDLRMAADPRRLGQVLFNIVSNAIKFTPVGGRVVVEADGSGDTVVIRTRDTGVGIPPEQMGELFLPFRQLNAGRPATAGGTGLGLYVSRGIVEQHGGQITCESPGLGQGSTFTLTLPRVPAAPERSGAGASGDDDSLASHARTTPAMTRPTPLDERAREPTRPLDLSRRP